MWCQSQMRIKRACTGIMLLVNAEHTMEIKVKNSS